MEIVPCVIVRLANSGQHLNIGSKCGFETSTQPASQALSPAKAVDDQKIDAISNRLHDRGLCIGEASLIKAASLCARAAILPDVERLLSSKIDYMDCCGAVAAALTGCHLHEAAEPQSVTRAPHAHVDKKPIDVETTRIVDRC